jgi:hypothetical protein
LLTSLSPVAEDEAEDDRPAKQSRMTTNKKKASNYYTTAVSALVFKPSLNPLLTLFTSHRTSKTAIASERPPRCRLIVEAIPPRKTPLPNEVVKLISR